MRRAILIGVVALLVVSVFLVGAVGASAAGKGKAGATLNVSPANPAPYTWVTFSGCGFEPSEGATVVMESPTAISFFGGPSDEAGCLVVTNTTNDPGQYTVKVYQHSSPKGTLMATAGFSVSQ